MQPARLIRFLALWAMFAWGAGLQGARKEAWVEVKSPHFVAYSDAGEFEARKALKGFEGIRSVFHQVFPSIRVDPPKPMLVIVTENEASMKRILPREFEGKDPVRPAGYFISGPDRNYAILRLDIDRQADQPYFVLFHEYTHSIVHQNFPSLPTWLDEGLADFYGATEIRSDQVFIGRIPVGRLMKLRQSIRLPLETLLGVTHDSPHYREGEKTGIFYAQSWALLHYLFMDEQAQKAGLFQAYLKATAVERDPLAAARMGFGDLAKFQGNLTVYSKRSTFSFWKLPLTVQLTDKDFQARALAEAEALVIRAEFLQHTRSEKESRPLLDQALGLAPQRPEVHTALGYGHFLRGEREKACSAFEESLRLGSQDFRSPYYLATLTQEGLGGGPQDSAKVLGWLESARSLRPDFPGIHMALCRQYSWNPRDPVRAIEAGRKGVELEPQNVANRVNLGIACINLDLEAEAKTIGVQLGQRAGTLEERQMADSYASTLARFLEQGKAAQAALQAGHSDAYPPSLQLSGAPLKISLPDHLAPLGADVMKLIAQGRTEDAIGTVEEAMAKARYDYDRKVLRSLLQTLRARVGAH